MFISERTHPDEVAPEPGLRWWRGRDYIIGWKGHLFWPELQAGEESVARLAASLADFGRGEASALAELAGSLGGVFGLFVYNRATHTWAATADNAGLYKLYRDPLGNLSTSFLQAARGEGVDPLAAAEFLALGGVHGNAALARGVYKLTGDSVVMSDGMAVLTKSRPKPEEMGGRLDELLASLGHQSVACDVTGGMDSRLLATVLHASGISAEAGIAAHRSDLPDVLLGSKVASTLRWPYFVETGMTDDLVTAHREGGGMLELWSWLKDRELAKARLARGVTLMVHGGGGELFSDFYHAQDFPFYGRAPDMARFYDLRQVPTPPPLSELTLRQVRENTVARFARAGGYDEAFLEARAPEKFGHQLSAYINMGLDVAAPYLDYAAATAAIRTPVWSRWRQSWHRRTMTKVNPQVAALPTTSGYTASAALRHVPMDMARYVKEMGRRAANKLGQKALGRPLAARPDAFDPGYPKRLRASPVAQGAVERTCRLLPDLDASRMSDRHYARAVTVGMTAMALEESERAPPTTAG